MFYTIFSFFMVWCHFLSCTRHNVDEAFHAMAKEGEFFESIESQSVTAKLCVSISQEVKDRVARQNPDPSTGTRSWGRCQVVQIEMIEMILQLLSMLQHVKRDSFGSMLEVFK